MLIRFESTIDEAVDVQIRLVRQSDYFRRTKRRGYFWAPVLFLGGYFAIPETWSIKLVVATLASVTFILIYPRIYDKTLRKRTRNYLAEQLGTDEPIPCEFEFTKEALTFRMTGNEIKFQWSTVKEINDNGDDIEIVTHTGGMAVLRNRFFSSPNQKDEWLKYARDKTGII